MTETTTHSPAIDTIAEAARLKDMLLALAHQAARVEQLARQAYMAQAEAVSPSEGHPGPSDNA